MVLKLYLNWIYTRSLSKCRKCTDRRTHYFPSNRELFKRYRRYKLLTVVGQSYVTKAKADKFWISQAVPVGIAYEYANIVVMK